MAPRVHPAVPSVRIASFNCKSLSNKDPEKTRWIADQIAQSNADVVALQEISKVAALSDLVTTLGQAEWDCITHTDRIDNARVHEYMGFVFKRSCIQPVGCLTFTPADRSQYVGTQGKLMARAPVYGRFLVKKLGFAETDVVIVSYHANQKNPMYDCIRIKTNIKAIQVRNTCNTVIVLGDFNTSCSDKLAFHKLTKKGWLPSLPHDVNTNTLNTEQYDNIWFHPDSCALLGGKPAQVMRDTGDHAHSDHCLVWCDLVLKRKLSDRAQFLQPPDMTTAMFEKDKKAQIKGFLCCGNSGVRE